MTKRLLSGVLTATGTLAFLGWGFIFAYADWLRFSSPRLPNASTNQVIYEKAARGVFYITPAQAFWVQTALLPTWLVGAASFAVLELMRRTSKAAKPPQSTRARIAGAVVIALWAVLFIFGDHVMSLIFTGSLTLPTTRP